MVGDSISKLRIVADVIVDRFGEQAIRVAERQRDIAYDAGRTGRGLSKSSVSWQDVLDELQARSSAR